VYKYTYRKRESNKQEKRKEKPVCLRCRFSTFDVGIPLNSTIFLSLVFFLLRKKYLVSLAKWCEHGLNGGNPLLSEKITKTKVTTPMLGVFLADKILGECYQLPNS